ncbi:hypothetical protein PWT90_03984 [Aphanocladium album]|nr:hypothetical protein PWT90_03984 [Aphanocladium album]
MEATTSVLAYASRLRSGITCAIANEEPRMGGSHRVYKLVFADSVVWAARENIDPNNWGLDLNATEKLRYIKEQRPNLRAPLTFVNKKDRVIYMEWLNGDVLFAWDHHISLANRCRFLDGLAEFLLQLWTVEAPPKFATQTDRSYSAWLTKSLDRGVHRTLNKTARWGDAIDYLIMRSMIPQYAAELDSYNRLGFAHGDMHAENMMRTEDFEFTGAIDWDWAYVGPLPAVIHHPWFLADIPGWNNHAATRSDNFLSDRFYLENAIELREKATIAPPTVSTLFRNSGSRFFFQSAFHLKGIHEKFVEMHCKRTEKNMEAAALQLDIVMEMYPDLRQPGKELKKEMASVL